MCIEIEGMKEVNQVTYVREQISREEVLYVAKPNRNYVRHYINLQT